MISLARNRTALLRALLGLSVGIAFHVSTVSVSETHAADLTSSNRPVGEWNRYRLKDGEFSVLLPAAPALTTYEAGFVAGSQYRLHHLIAAYHQGIVYVIHVYEKRQLSEEFIRSFRPRLNSDYKRDLTMFGMTGKEYGYESANAKGVARFLSSKKRTYVFAAFSSILGNADVDLPQFFESISFERPVEGSVLIDGPSEAQSAYSPPVTDADSPTYMGREVTAKAIVLSKPEPKYTDEGRQAGQRGTVVLRCVFSASGEVTNIKEVRGLPYGLTESAVAAARQIKFIPPIKDGRFVSMFVQIEYNFNIY